jgi:hypothetical protein
VRRVLYYAGAAVVGAGVLMLGLLLFDGGSVPGGEAAQAIRGVPPPDYAYLDNARVVLYLGQLQGGLAKSAQLTEQLTSGRNATVSAGGVSLGGTAGRSSSLERVVTPTATARFYELLRLLGKYDYLTTVDAAAPPKRLVGSFEQIPEGSFVMLRRCRLQLPSYVQLGRLAFGSSGYVSASNAYQGAGGRTALAQDAFANAWNHAHPDSQTLGSAASMGLPGAERRIERAIAGLAKVVARNPRVPVSTCDAAADLRPRGVDLLFPIRLAALSSEPTLLAGPVTVVGKLVRKVTTGHEYVDEPSLATFTSTLANVDEAAGDDSAPGLGTQLDADATVLAPGAVILPIAIYK